jgi:YidC/Oxa1 family membrane protein insertase
MALMFFKVPCGLCLYFIASSLWGIAERLWLPTTTSAAAAAGGATVVDAPFAAVSKNGAAAGDAVRQKRQARKKQR